MKKAFFISLLATLFSRTAFASSEADKAMANSWLGRLMGRYVDFISNKIDVMHSPPSEMGWRAVELLYAVAAPPILILGCFFWGLLYAKYKMQEPGQFVDFRDYLYYVETTTRGVGRHYSWLKIGRRATAEQRKQARIKAGTKVTGEIAYLFVRTGNPAAGECVRMTLINHTDDMKDVETCQFTQGSTPGPLQTVSLPARLEPGGHLDIDFLPPAQAVLVSAVSFSGNGRTWNMPPDALARMKAQAYKR